ncbi:ASCH domain-containing protein [Sphingomonas sp. PAMC26645]|uniref:ASCH domain-containing protein n=1 Tax=Sphingomonas TaxID=13687 RepID=UPI00109DDB94|nr:ASCH domain-containing protein [Sphingomonas sp. PAMC26645]QCB42194.1 ASCH domain-containing protein [Sphingomonas sp. PAMC26645]
MKVLLSIKPEFAERIFDGSKRFEFRRSVFRDRSVQTVVLYVTRPVGMIIGEFDVARIITATPDGLWEHTSEYAGISREFFDSYFDGRPSANAIEVAEARRFASPIEPASAIENFTPPQSYMYVSDDLGRVKGDDRQLELL